MSKQVPNMSNESKLLVQILSISQQTFILQALQAGLSTEAVRKLLKIDYLRVIEISKYLKQAQKKAKNKNNGE